MTAKEIADDVQQTFDGVTNSYRQILEDRINLLVEEKVGSILANLPSCRPLGEDMDGNEIFPNDTVLIDGDETLPLKIEHGKYRDKFDCGYVIGYYVPDYCKKVKIELPNPNH